MSDTNSSNEIVDVDIEIDEGVITSASGPKEAQEAIDKTIGKSPLDESED